MARIGWQGAALAMVPLLVACGASDGGEWTGAVRDSAGIQIVENPAEGIWSDAERPGVVEEVRIGSAGGGDDAFGAAVSGVTVDDDGNIYVADMQAQRIQVFGPDGAFLRTIGRPGSGPGELGAAVVGVFVIRDTLFVPDMMNQRVNVYPLGEEEGTSFPLDIMTGLPMRWDVLPDGRMATQVRTGVMPGTGDAGVQDLVLVRNTRGEVVDTLMELPSGQTFDFTSGQPRMRVFSAEPVWSIGPDGTVVYADNSHYRLHVAGPQGEVQRIITREVEPKPVTEADKNAILDLIREQVAATGAPAEAVEPMLAGMQFAEFYPTMALVLAGPDGTVWAQRFRSAQDFAETGREFDPQRMGSPTWDVFDAEGRYLGTVEMPEGFQPITWKDGRLYGVLRDEMDVNYVVRLRVEGLPGETFQRG